MNLKYEKILVWMIFLMSLVQLISLLIFPFSSVLILRVWEVLLFGILLLCLYFYPSSIKLRRLILFSLLITLILFDTLLGMFFAMIFWKLGKSDYGEEMNKKVFIPVFFALLFILISFSLFSLLNNWKYKVALDYKNEAIRNVTANYPPLGAEKINYLWTLTQELKTKEKISSSMSVSDLMNVINSQTDLRYSYTQEDILAFNRYALQTRNEFYPEEKTCISKEFCLDGETATGIKKILIGVSIVSFVVMLVGAFSWFRNSRKISTDVGVLPTQDLEKPKVE